jgi:hypothetical protein
MVLESPCAHARLVLESPRALALIGAMATPVSVDDLTGRVDGLPAGAATSLVGLLTCAGMLQGRGPGDESPGLRAWEFHDLLFHARSRRGRSDAAFGATYRPEAGPDPPPAFPDEGPGVSIELTRRDPDGRPDTDPSLASVMEARHSIREYGGRPLTVAQLGEFLDRVARVRSCCEVEAATPHGPVSLTLAKRPFPSGGALYELEFHIAVGSCQGLDPGRLGRDPLDDGPGAPDPGHPAPSARLEVLLDRLHTHAQTRRCGLPDHVPRGDGNETRTLRPRRRRLRPLRPGDRARLPRRDARGGVSPGEPGPAAIAGNATLECFSFEYAPPRRVRRADRFDPRPPP